MQPTTITQLSELDLNGTYTYADYLLWQVQERLELIKGHIFKMSPAPNLEHQRASSRLHGYLFQFLHGKTCQIFSAPFDVRLYDKKKRNPKKDDLHILTVVQPDICVVCDAKKLDRRGCLGAPDLVIEILSPATAQKDLNEKYFLYEENGVREYWIVQPGSGTVTVFDLNETTNKYQLRKIYAPNDKVPVGIFAPECEIDLNEVFGDIENW